jgi:hypothetical protein
LNPLTGPQVYPGFILERLNGLLTSDLLSSREVPQNLILPLRASESQEEEPGAWSVQIGELHNSTLIPNGSSANGLPNGTSTGENTRHCDLSQSDIPTDIITGIIDIRNSLEGHKVDVMPIVQCVIFHKTAGTEALEYYRKL